MVDNININQKKYLQYKLVPEEKLNRDKHLINTDISKGVRKSNILIKQSYQNFITKFLSPYTNYKRLLLKWDVGSGKTIGALSIANEFLKLFRYTKIAKNEDISNRVIIIGFKQELFKRDLIKFPHFGFITKEEIDDYNKYNQKLINNPNNLIARKKIKEYKMLINKRLKKQNIGGFFEFYGYIELVNKLFDYDINEIILSKLNEEKILELIRQNKIIINTKFLNKFKNSLIICDEIHSVYNSEQKNNWGIAIQYILNNAKNTKAVFLTATPMTNNPMEIIDLLNLLSIKNKYNKKDFFDEYGNLKSGKDKELALLFRNKISYLRDLNPNYFAKQTFIGEKINSIDFLLFNKCFMSKFQLNTIKEAIKNKAHFQDIEYINDFAIPNPKSNNYGIINTSKFITVINNSSKQWKNENKIDVINDKIYGDLLRYENINKFSAKYYSLLTNIFNNIKNKEGKIFIYHKYVHITGIYLLEEILRKNGIIKYGELIKNTTICHTCSKRKEIHENNNIEHKFIPVSFVSAHGEMDENLLFNYLNIYNMDNNTNGSLIHIIIGSKKMEEGYNLMSTRNVYFVHRPNNIPTLNQINGRALRKGAHQLLEPNEREIKIKIFVSSIDKKKLSLEETKYKLKIETYKIIRILERIIHKNAIDSYLNYDIISNTFKFYDENSLNILHYKPNILPNKSIVLDNFTYNLTYQNEEINYIIILIKRLFFQVSRVWSYDKLWNYIHKPPFKVEINSNMLNKINFNMALNFLVWNFSDNFINPKIKKYQVDDNINKNNEINKYIELFNPENKFIYLSNNNIPHVIYQVNKYYMLLGFDINKWDIKLNIESIYRVSKIVPIIDIPIDNILSSTFKINKYDDLLNKLYNKYEGVDINDIKIIDKIFDLSFQKSFIKNIIEYYHLYFLNSKKRHKYHNFFLKMLIYYDLKCCILWSNTINENLLTEYKNYLNNDQSKKFIYKSNTPMLKNNINFKNVLRKKIKTYQLKKAIYYILMDNLLNKDILLYYDLLKNMKNDKNKINNDILPVGFFVNNRPIFYSLKRKWYKEKLFIQIHKNFNQKVFGFDSFDEQFNKKFRIKHVLLDSSKIEEIQDKRLLEKGEICLTKNKTFLKEILAKLNISIPAKKKVKTKDICKLIKIKLILKDVEDKNLRWFFYSHENF